MHTISTIERNRAIIGWEVTLIPSRDVRSTVIVLIGELPIMEAPTEHQILHVAKTKLFPPAPPKPMRKRRDVQRQLSDKPNWTRAHDACQDISNRWSLCIDQIVSLLPDALASLQHEWESIELAKRTAREITGLTHQDIERLENAYRDHSTIHRFDECANEMALRHPELNWNYGEDNGARLWALLSEPLKRKPSRLSGETVQRAAEFATDRARGEIEFSDWDQSQSWETSNNENAELETVPF